MTMPEVKTKYNIGDAVWIHGVSRENKLVKGKVVQVLDLSSIGYLDGPHYIVAVSTGVEDLLEIRTWETMSENAKGPIGSLQNLSETADAIHKRLKQVGYNYSDDDLIIDEPTPEQIHAALERTIKSDGLGGMSQKPKRKFYGKKRKP